MCYTQVKWYTARDDVSITRYVLHTFHILSITVDSIRSILSNTYIHTFNNSPWRNHDVSRNAIGAPGPDPHHYTSKTNEWKDANMNKTRKRRKGKVLPRWYKIVVNSLFLSSIWKVIIILYSRYMCFEWLSRQQIRESQSRIIEKLMLVGEVTPIFCRRSDVSEPL